MPMTWALWTMPIECFQIVSLFILMIVEPHDTITHNYGQQGKKYQPHY